MSGVIVLLVRTSSPRSVEVQTVKDSRSSQEKAKVGLMVRIRARWPHDEFVSRLFPPGTPYGFLNAGHKLAVETNSMERAMEFLSMVILDRCKKIGKGSNRHAEIQGNDARFTYRNFQPHA